jgi:preprotein translocase subunit YajC
MPASPAAGRNFRETPMDFLISSAHAQAAAPAGAQGIGGLLGSPIIFIVIMVAMMFFMFRSQSKRQKELRNMIAALAKGDEIVTNGGMAGRVDDIGDTFMTVEIAPNVKIKLQKSAVSLVLPKGTLKST